MPEYHPGEMGGTMRLGKRTTIFKDTAKNSKLMKLYGFQKSIDERHRHRYEINTKYVEDLEKKGMQFIGTDSANERMEIMELDDHPYYVAVQFHPEYLSRPLKPSPPFMGLILAAMGNGKLTNYINRNCKLSPREMSDNSSGEISFFCFVIEIKFHFFIFYQDDDEFVKRGPTSVQASVSNALSTTLLVNGLTNGLSDGSTQTSSEE